MFLIYLIPSQLSTVKFDFFSATGLKYISPQFIVLLAGGSKRTQKSDINRAKTLAALLD